MTSQPANPVEVFYSYAHEDEKLRDELKKHLANLKRQGIITDWYDRDISAGKGWDDEIKAHLDSASVILLLVSPDFMNSDYSNDVEVKRAMERHEAGEARVIPIILRPVDWEGAPFSKLQGLPTDAKAVTLWQNPDEAFLSVVTGIRTALKELTREADDRPSTVNIPRPPVVGFVARRDSEGRDIVERLKEELAPERNQLIALSGPGGVGKTTLAAEAARVLGSVVGGRLAWTSALGREDFSLSTLLDDIATQLGQPALRPLASDSKAAQVQALIALEPTLIILDNFETISEPEQTRCVEFLLNRVPCPALITTRQKITSARNITIPVMSPEEADMFLQLLIDQSSDPSAFAQLDSDHVMEASECNPLVMQWVVAQIDLAQDANAVLKELAQGGGDAAQRVFDRSFGLRQLGNDGRAVLLALSLFAPDALRTALAEVAGFGEDMKRLNEAVRRLASLWLVKAAPGGSRLTVQGLTRELTKARLSKDEQADEFRKRFVAYFLTYTEERAQPTPEAFDELEMEKDNLLGAMDVASEIKDWSALQRIAFLITLPSTGVLAVHGYWDEAIQRGQEGLRVAKATDNQWYVGAFANGLGGLFSDQGNYPLARQHYQMAVEVARQLNEQQGLAATLYELGALARSQGEIEEAGRLYNESLEINEKLGNQGGIAKGLHELARLAQYEGELDEAKRLYNESLGIKKRLGNQGGIAYTLHQLAMLAQDQGELDEAWRLYNESLKIRKRLGDQMGIASGLHQLGRLAEDEGDPVEAAQLFGEAVAILEKLKSPDAEIARRSLARVKGKSS